VQVRRVCRATVAGELGRWALSEEFTQARQLIDQRQTDKFTDMGIQQKQVLAEEKNALTEPVTPEESAAIIALWNKKQQEADNSTKLTDVAEALDLTPEQAERLLEEVRTQQKRQGWLSRTLQKTPLARINRNAPSLSPWVSIPMLLMLGLGSSAWTLFSVETLSNIYASSLWEKMGFVGSDAGLWFLVVQFARSLYQNRIGRRRKPW